MYETKKKENDVNIEKSKSMETNRFDENLKKE